jgi:hypothetical protein
MQLLYFGLVICIIAIPLLFFSLYRWYQARKNKRAPFSDVFLRSPGQSLNDKIQNLSDEINIYYGYVMTLPIFILSTAFIYKIDLIYSILIIALVELLLFKRLWQYLNERRDYRLGYDGEVAVGQELNLLMLDGYHVFHDLVSDTITKYNIDHIVVGSSGVYAVETKTRSKSSDKKGSKNSTVIFDGASLIFPRYTDTSSLKQTRINAIWLQKWLTSAVGEPVNVEAILTIPGWFVERKAPPRGVYVLNPKQIRGFLKGQKEKPLSDSIVNRIVHQLDQRCRNVEPLTVQIEKEERKQAEGV